VLAVEFDPTPKELEASVALGYGAADTLVVQFELDRLDQSHRLVELLGAASHSQVQSKSSNSTAAATTAHKRQNIPSEETYEEEEEEEEDMETQQQEHQEQHWELKRLPGNHGTPNDLNPSGTLGFVSTEIDEEEEGAPVAVEVQILAGAVADFLTGRALW